MFLDFIKWVKSIQTAGYNGARTVFEIYFRLLRRKNKLKINKFLTNIWRNYWRFNIWRRKRTPLLSSFWDNHILNILASKNYIVHCIVVTKRSPQNLRSNIDTEYVTFKRLLSLHGNHQAYITKHMYNISLLTS